MAEEAGAITSRSHPSVVLMTADAMTGVWTYALELTRALAPHGVAVALATMGAPLDGRRRAEAAELDNLELFESDYRLEWMSDPWDDVARAGRWLLELRDRIRPDVAHLNGYVHAALPWGLPTLVAAHSCVLSRWAAVRPGTPTLGHERYQREVARGLRSADIVIAPTRAMLDCVLRHYGPLASTRVIPGGRDCSWFPPRAKEAFVLAAGRLWDEAENIGALDRVAAGLGWPVYVAGERTRPNGGSVEIRHARALGHLAPPALAEWLGRASIYAHPARYEPFGLGVVEAALAGCALVLGDIPSLRELWDDAALFVDPEDLSALHGGLRALCEDATHRSSLAQRARALALDLSPARMAQDYLAAYALAEMARSPSSTEITA
jgi:glycosyltransferase involved in cell wall biosynthesis